MRSDYDVPVRRQNRRDNQVANRRRMPVHGATFYTFYTNAFIRREQEKRAKEKAS